VAVDSELKGYFPADIRWPDTSDSCAHDNYQYAEYFHRCILPFVNRNNQKFLLEDINLGSPLADTLVSLIIQFLVEERTEDVNPPRCLWIILSQLPNPPPES
jgi:hypothetical protein